MSGEISFDRETGYTDRAVDMAQIRTNELASYQVQNVTEFIFISDSFPSNVRESRVVVILAVIVAIVQVLLTLTFHVLTVIYRKQPSLKASSLKLLHISYAGVYIVALGLLAYFFYLAARLPDKIRHYFCQLLWGWCMPVGFMLSTAPVAMRTWRVYRIFKHYLNPGPLISDPILIGGIVTLTLPVLTVSIVWTAIDAFRVEKTFEISGMVRVKEECTCTHYYVWHGIMLTYLTVALVLLAIFSLLTRNISNRSFATTALRVLAYILTVAFLLGFPLFYLTTFSSFNPDYGLAIFIIQMNFMLAVFIACVFVPPLLPIFQSLKQRVRRLASPVSVVVLPSYS